MPPSANKPQSSGRNPRRNLAGKVIRKLRKAQGLTRDELAAKIHVRGWDISHKVVERVENGRREVNDIELRAFAKALRVPVAILLETT